ncbi:MAG: DUF4367 domain-containing protein [Lachnospiraceae bacterium]|nr:DUF4367 domain-containing protein [Lachnospiraceae bacterium]
MNKENDFDAILRQAVHIACEEELNTITRKTNMNTHIFTTEFEKKINKLFDAAPARTNEVQIRKKKRYRVLFVAAAIITINVCIVMANEDLRNRIGDVIVSIYEHCVGLTNEQQTDFQPENFVQYQPNYMPKGYISTEELYVDGTEYQIEYEDAASNQIIYIQCIKSADILVSYETEEKRENLEVNGISAEIVSDGDINTIFFEMGDYVFVVSAPEQLETEELTKIAENISFWNKYRKYKNVSQYLLVFCYLYK